MKALQGRTAFGQTPPAKPLQGRQHGRKSAAATGPAGHREIARGVAPGVEDSSGLSQRKNQKIAAFGSSYRRSHSSVGAAEGCDLLLLAIDFVSIAPIEHTQKRR
jgi:hypothetical protein